MHTTIPYYRYDDPAEVCRELAVTTLTGLMQVWGMEGDQKGMWMWDEGDEFGDEGVAQKGKEKLCEAL